MSQNRVSGSRARRLGAALAAMTLTLVGLPAVAHADTESGSLSVEQLGESTGLGDSTGEGSVDDLVDRAPDEIVVGGPTFGSEGLTAAGSGEIVDAALSVGQTLGSVAPLEAIVRGRFGGRLGGLLRTRSRFDLRQRGRLDRLGNHRDRFGDHPRVRLRDAGRTGRGHRHRGDG